MDKEYSAQTCLWIGSILGLIVSPFVILMNKSDIRGWIGFVMGTVAFCILIWVGIGGGNWDHKKIKMERYLDERKLKDEALYEWRREE